MTDLSTLLRRNRRIRVIGFDDTPFERKSRGRVSVCGVVCADTRFEGMLWGSVVQDGWSATQTLVRMLKNSKFLPQLHIVLLDGIALGGFNVVDLPRLHQELRLPCVAVMRRHPDFDAVESAIGQLPNPERRLKVLRKAGPIHHSEPFWFQVAGESPDTIAGVLDRVTDTGKVPEALRLAHLIGSAVKTGESGRRA